MNRSLFRIPLIYLFLVASLGTFLRFSAFLPDLTFDYRHVLHAHSHVAFQAWVYSGLFLLLVTAFLSPETQQKGRYRLQFWLTQLIFPGIMVAFVFQGYAGISIALSTAFQFFAYWFIWRFLKDLKKSGAYFESPIGSRLVLVGLLAFVLSTFGPYALGILSAKGLKATEWYNRAIYFYLHFQYNGAFSFLLLGLIIKNIEKTGRKLSSRSLSTAFFLIAGSLFPAFILSIAPSQISGFGLWTSVLSGLGWVSALSQICGSAILVIFIAKAEKGINQYCLVLALSAFLLKNCLQFLSVFPQFENLAFGNRDVIVAFLHLVLVAWVSLGMLYLAWNGGFLQITSKRLQIGLHLFSLGFLGMEGLLLNRVFEWTALPLDSNYILGLCSGIMAVGCLLLIFSQNQPESLPNAQSPT